MYINNAHVNSRVFYSFACTQMFKIIGFHREVKKVLYILMLLLLSLMKESFVYCYSPVCCPLHALSFFAVIFQHYIIIIADTQYNTKMQKMSHIMNIYFITTPISALQTIIK